MYSRCTWRFICNSPLRSAGAQVREGYLIDSAQLAQMSRKILASFGEHLRTHLKDHTGYDQGPEIHAKPKKSVAPSQQSSAGWMLESMGKWSVGVGRKHPVTMRKVLFKTLSIRRV